jgi:hypothetical protein
MSCKLQIVSDIEPKMMTTTAVSTITVKVNCAMEDVIEKCGETEETPWRST